jgi:predicted anti-sigma-YlaC factor YlaD
VNDTTTCDRIRQQFMASLDGEAGPPPAEADVQHAATCLGCRHWLQEFESLNGRLNSLTYPQPEIDLWIAVRERIHQAEPGWSLTHRLVAIGVAVLAWRVLQLLVDLPLPWLHPAVPIAAVIATLWQMAGDPLAVTTFAPELQKRGI